MLAKDAHDSRTERSSMDRFFCSDMKPLGILARTNT